MILQTNSKLNAKIHEYGCYFMDIVWHAVRKKGLEVTPEIINTLYDKAIAAGGMNENCLILNPDVVFKTLGLDVKYTGRHEKPSRRCAMNEIEILKFTNPTTGFSHFVAGDGYGHVAYDSLGESVTVREGYLESKRIFKVEV